MNSHTHQIMPDVEVELDRQAYAPKTKRNYAQCISRFLEYYKGREYGAITYDDVVAYIKFIETRRNLKPQTVSLEIYALTFFFNIFLKKSYDFDSIPRRARVYTTSAEVFTPSEVMELFNVTTNLKHKLVMMFMYSSGLTGSQAVNLKISDVDIEHKLVKAKAYNNRKLPIISTLADALIPLLLKYTEEEKPNKYLFPGYSDKPIHERTVHYSFAAALKKAGISKKISFKDFRHTYVVHLRDHGYPLKAIFDAWGTDNSSSYKRYSIMGLEPISHMPSPLDLIQSSKTIDPIDDTVLRNLINRIQNDDEKDYFTEAATCLRCGALRGAVVMMWAAAIRNIQERCIRFLPGLNASLQKQYQKAKQVDSIEDFAYVKESHAIQAAHDVGLFDKNQKEALKDCLDI